MAVSRPRLVAVVLATPLSLFAYHPLAAIASTPSCAGHAATKVVTASSPHIVLGHREGT